MKHHYTLLRGALAALLLSSVLCACGGSGGSSGSSGSTASTAATSTPATNSNSGATAASSQVALSSASYAVPSTAASVVVTVDRSGTSQGEASVNYATVAGTAVATTDYTPTSGTLTWADGDVAPKLINVPVRNSGTSKSFGVALTSTTGSASLGSPVTATVTMAATAASASTPSAVPTASSSSGASSGAVGTSSGASSSSSSSGSSSGSSTSSSSSSSSSGKSSSSSSSGSSSGTTNGTTAGLLKYMTGLSGQTKHILAGQHSSYWNSNPMDYEQAAASQTGKTVAILGTTSGQEGSTENTVTLTNAWLAKGGIPMVSWWPVDPFTGKTDNDRNIDFAQLTQPGTAAYVAWYKLLDQQIALLKQIKGPVLYRPLVEMNGNWSWWDGQPTGEMVTVWQQMHDYFAAQGVTNVLWVYNVNGWSGNYTQYFPGSAYVDIVSWDAYPPSASDPSYSALVTLNKPIIIAESGVESEDNSKVATNSGDNSKLLATVKANFPKVVGLVIFCQNWAISQQNGAAAFMNDPAVVSMSDLPSGLVDP